MTNSALSRFFYNRTNYQVISRTTEQFYKTYKFYASGKIVLFSCHFKRNYCRNHHVKIA